MTKKDDMVLAFQRKQMEFIEMEENTHGGYDKWYRELGEFRNYIKKKYVVLNLMGKVFRTKKSITSYGDIIDHHVLSYLAPMSFSRVGWNGERMEMHQHMKYLSEYFTSRGKRFIYAALPNKGAVYPFRISDDENMFVGGGAGQLTSMEKICKRFDR